MPRQRGCPTLNCSGGDADGARSSFRSPKTDCPGPIWGDGTTTQRLTPVDVIGITGATAIAVGVDHSCAILGNGSARCWGYNIAGQVGDGTSGYVTIPAAARRVDPAFVFKAGFELDE